MNEMKKAIVIYHANCMDGFGSAWAFHKLKEYEYLNGAEYLADSYGSGVQNEDVIDGLDVYILDFSYKREELARICKFANKVVLLDHHKTAQADLENWEDKPENLEIIFDMGRSGAGITWDYFCLFEDHITGEQHEEPRPALINFVEDRDLWKFNLPASKQVNAVIAIAKKTFEAWDELDEAINVNVKRVEREGKLLEAQHRQICEDIIKDARSCLIHDQEGNAYAGLVANCTAQFASEVGNLLAKKTGTFGATYFTDGSGATKWSLRSEGDYDVSKIARSYGGGGHKNAAGFIIPGNSEVDGEHMVHLWRFKEDVV